MRFTFVMGTKNRFLLTRIPWNSGTKPSLKVWMSLSLVLGHTPYTSLQSVPILTSQIMSKIKQFCHQLNLIGDHRVDILLEDKPLSVSRPIMEPQILFPGDQILIENLKNVPLAKSYAVSFSQDHSVRKILKTSAWSSHIRGVQSYQQCDDTFIHQLYIDHQLPDSVCLSVWFSTTTLAQNTRLAAIFLWE